MPDGSLLRPDYYLTLVAPNGRRRVVAGGGATLGMGDGGRAGRASMDAQLVDARLDGSWIVADKAPADPPHPFDRLAYRSSTGGLVTDSFRSPLHASRVRFAGAQDPGVPVIALRSSTYRLLKRGMFAYHSSFAGTATLIVRAAGRSVTYVPFPVTAGDAHHRLPDALPAGDYRLELRVSDGVRIGAHRLAVSLTPRLDRTRALRLTRRVGGTLGGGGDAGGGSLGEASHCRRGSIKHFICAGIRVEYEGDVFTPRCTGVIGVRLRPDGARGYSVRRWRKCPRLVPRTA